MPAAVVGDEISAIDARLVQAAQLVHSSTDPTSIAEAIDAVPADAWGDELDDLRRIALDLGRYLRAVAAANPDLDG